MVAGGTRGSDTVRVLVVDDDPAVVDLASEYIEYTDSRFCVHTEVSAPAALEHLCESDAGYDCIVSDYKMPEMNGYEFLSAVRACESDVPFILFTSQGRDLFEERPPESLTDFIKKDGTSGRYAQLAERIGRAADVEAL
jgi:CheY-like chemotaxis protein